MIDKGTPHSPQGGVPLFAGSVPAPSYSLALLGHTLLPEGSKDRMFGGPNMFKYVVLSSQLSFALGLADDLEEAHKMRAEIVAKLNLDQSTVWVDEVRRPTARREAVR